MAELLRFRQFLNDHSPSPELDAAPEPLHERNLFRNASATFLAARINALKSTVHKSDDLNEKLDAIASQNVMLAATVFAMTQFKRNNNN
jgi:hypothetical protein